MPLTGGNLEGAKLDAMLSFPAQIKQAFSQWQISATEIDNHEVQVRAGDQSEAASRQLLFRLEPACWCVCYAWSTRPSAVCLHRRTTAIIATCPASRCRFDG